MRKKKPGRFGRDDKKGAAHSARKWESGGVVYHVYILASASGVLYTGVTNCLERRAAEHKQGTSPGFTKRYGVTRLVYFEGFGDVRDAISREKQIKRWRREKKLEIIRAMNPALRDLSEDFYR